MTSKYNILDLEDGSVAIIRRSQRISPECNSTSNLIPRDRKRSVLALHLYDLRSTDDLILILGRVKMELGAFQPLGC